MELDYFWRVKRPIRVPFPECFGERLTGFGVVRGNRFPRWNQGVSFFFFLFLCPVTRRSASGTLCRHHRVRLMSVDTHILVGPINEGQYLIRASCLRHS